MRNKSEKEIEGKGLTASIIRLNFQSDPLVYTV